ncbi:MAG TPA: YjbH domain-containing protein [Rhizomicrobium sp.]|nr:YjbH domain-containing protein [Rhizomicrobium sp.]
MATKHRRRAFARRLTAPGMAVALGCGVPAMALLGAAAPAAAGILDEQPWPIRNMYGEVGLLDMPSARMAEDGQIAVFGTALKHTQRVGLSFQALPWMEVSFRYSRLPKYTEIDKSDRSFGLKLRLLEESANLPELSLGLRDLVGTGAFGSEYLVASKRLFRDIDVTLGVGWGRLGSSGALHNPVAEIFSGAKMRGAPHPSSRINFDQLFRGPDLGVFGGVSWHTPIPHLDFIVEYSSDRYLQETRYGMIDQRMPVNFGLAYRPFAHVTLGASFLYGNTFGLSLTLDADPTRALEPARLGQQAPPVHIRTLDEQQAAIAGLMRYNTQSRSAPADTPWLPTRYASSDDRYALNDALSAMTPGVLDYEIDGYSLLVNTRNKPSQAACKAFARLPGLAGMQLKSVAVSNLRKGDGRVATCNVASGGVQLASAAAPGRDVYVGEAPPPLPRAIAPDEVERNLTNAARAQGLIIDAVDTRRGEMWVYFTNHHYYLEAEAVGRLTRLAMAHASPEIEVFHLISVEHGVALRETKILRSSLERTLSASGNISELDTAVTILPAPMDNPALETLAPRNYPRWTWAISPETRQNLFETDQPVQGQILIGLASSVDLFPGITVAGKVDINIYNNFANSKPSTSELAPVRSDAQRYYKNGINGIANLTAAWRTRLGPDLFAKLEGGYLEDMFGGVGAQIVWRPENSRIILGADIYQVWQRNFDRMISFLPYHVVTGHLSVYYESPWAGLNFNLHAGRYLAGDYGGTLEITRRFDSGVEIGAFATLTNTSFRKRGEGGFDKGVIVRLPLEWGVPIHTQSAYTMTLRPLQRDGGQRLDDDDSLYNETRRTSYGAFAQHLNEIPNP